MMKQIRSAPSGPLVSVLVPPDVFPPDPTKFLNEAGFYTTPAGTGVSAIAGANGIIPTTPQVGLSVLSLQANLYTVGPIGVARFQTIQAAINQAQADGASFDKPATIYIQAGYYAENLVITGPSAGGNMALIGVGADYGVYIDGTLTVNNGGTTNGWVFQNISVTGVTTFVGTSTFGYSVFTQACEFYQRVTVQQANCVWRDFLGRFRATAGDAILFTLGNSTASWFFGSRIFCALNVRAIAAAGTFFACYVVGSFTLLAASGAIQHTTIYADQTCILNQASGTSEVLHCSLLQIGTPAINKTGSGVMRQLGNYLRPSATLPYILIGAGSVDTGILMV